MINYKFKKIYLFDIWILYSKCSPSALRENGWMSEIKVQDCDVYFYCCVETCVLCT